MQRDEIDVMWQQALQDSVKDGEMFTRYHFAKLVAAKERERIYFETSTDFVKSAVAAEREACAMVCEDYGTHNITINCAATIRARGEA